MAIVYFPSNTKIAQRNTVSASYEVIAFANYPNVIFFFDSGSNLQAISSSVTDAISASYAQSASYAANAGGGSSTQTLQLPVQSAKMSGSNINAAHTNWELRFPMSGSAIWQFRMPDNYASGLKNTIQFYPTQSQFGTQTVSWRMDLTHIAANTTASVSSILPQLQISLTHSLDLNQSASWLRQESVFLTGSSLAGGDFVIYKLYRVSGSADTATGSIAVVSNMLEWTTQ